MKNLVKAILAVMADVENIDKNMSVGSGNNAYKGVSDKDVKIAVVNAMLKNGLIILPIGIETTTKVDRWEEDTYYNGQKSGVKSKQSVFTEVNTKYLLMHESGESMEIVGYGHGVDSQDKSAGKATTYALKNALLYTFLVPTGTIDDADKTHSEELATPEKSKKTQESKTASLPTGIAPSLVGVIAKAENLDSLNKIWSNNVPLHENKAFVKLVAFKRIEFATSKEDLSKIFDDSNILHADADFVSNLTAKKLVLSEVNKQTA